MWQPAIEKLESFHAVGQAWKVNTNLASNVINLLTVNPTVAYHIKGLVDLYPVDFMLNTGASVSLLNVEVWDRVKRSCSELVELHKPELVGVGGAPIRVQSTNKNTYVLVVSDYFTRYTEAYALPNQEAKTVTQKLVNEFFCSSLYQSSYTVIKVGNSSQTLLRKSPICCRSRRAGQIHITLNQMDW